MLQSCPLVFCQVCIIPGSSCGAPGHVRAAFANLPPDATRQAAVALKAGLQELVQRGPSVLTDT
jgi:aromatic aminotransferase